MNNVATSLADEFHASQHPTETLMKGSGLLTISAGSKISYSTRGTKTVRRNAIIANTSGGAIDILDGAGAVAYRMAANSSFLLETGDDFSVKNPQGSDAVVTVCEFFISLDVVNAATVVGKVTAK